jgi:uncharacterized membrane protein YfcA
VPLPHLSPAIALAGALVGFTAGLTGMGGGVLGTPLLILVCRVPAPAAVASTGLELLVQEDPLP